MKNKKDIIFSFLIYGIGLLAFLLVDLYVVQNFTKSNIAEWAFLKSVIIIAGSICLLGYDHVFIRDSSLIQRFFRKFNLQSIIIILFFTFLLLFIKQYSIKKLIVLSISIYLYAILNYLSASYRAKFNLWKSQLATNFWRLLLLLSVIFINYREVNDYFLQSLLFSLVVMLFIGGYKLLKKKENNSVILDDKSAKKLGYSFLLTNITLIFSVYGEQFLINLQDNTDISSHLFTYVSIFTPVALCLNGYIGFYLGQIGRAHV